MNPGQGDEQVCKVHLSQDKANGRHDDVLYEGSDHTAESCTNDDADSHIKDVAFHGELLKLVYEPHNFPLPRYVINHFIFAVPI